jgi:hypothetical protein
MASQLNHYAISRILGSKMRPVKHGRFGGFSLLEATAEALRSRDDAGHSLEEPKFSYKDDEVVVRAFEDVRQGAAPDSILWDKELAQRFYNRCRELGLMAPDAFLGRRLINVRKNSPRYKEHGIEISPTTKTEPHPSIVPQYAHAIEFALVRLRYRYGTSIDDILLDHELGNKFEELAAQIAQGLSSEQLRLGALYIRKTRYIQKNAIDAMRALDTRVVEAAMEGPVTLAAVQPESLPAEPGLIEIKERSRYLYVSRNDNLQSAVSQIRTGRAFEILANGFWTPDLEAITLKFVHGERVEHVGIPVWERRLIHDFEPVFNWPVQKKAA